MASPRRRCGQDDADVLIADANVFYDDAKYFGPNFDQQIRKCLNRRLRTIPFDVDTEPRVLLLYTVAWRKLFKKSFLERHTLQFEEFLGVSALEDIIFHISVLLKAKRISLIDDVLYLYRRNRPGQITEGPNKATADVFDVFDKIMENLLDWEVSDEIWAILIVM